MESIVEISEFFRKLEFICHWTDSFKNLKWSNVLGIKLSSFFESDDTFTRCEVTVTILDNGYWHTMPGDYFFDVQPGKGFHLLSDLSGRSSSRTGVPVGLIIVHAIVAACASRAAV
ncbi:hypothetical protein Tco_0615725 [Tanacetum coccineum]